MKAVIGFRQYSARASNDMAQYFKRQGFAVDSIQLELSKQLRGMFLVDFAEALSKALQAAIEPDSTAERLPAVKVSVEQAASKVIEICSGHLYEAALDVGKYFVKTLYEGDYERAKIRARVLDRCPLIGFVSAYMLKADLLFGGCILL